MTTRETAGKLFIEGLVIVVSILLAFAIDAWWDDRQQEQEWLRIQDQLRSELETYQAIVPRAIQRSDEAIAAAEFLLGVIHGDQPATDLQIQEAIESVDETFVLAASAPVFDLLTDGGKFGVVPDPELREAVSSISMFISLVRGFEQTEEQVIGKWMAFLQSRYDQFGSALATGQLSPSMPTSRYDIDFSFMNEREFSNLLLERRDKAMELNRFRERVLEHTQIAMDIIDRSNG